MAYFAYHLCHTEQKGRSLYKPTDRPSYTFEGADADGRSYYRGRDGGRYCLYNSGQHGSPQVRFCRCTEGGEPVLVLAMPFASDFDRYVSPVKESGDA